MINSAGSRELTRLKDRDKETHGVRRFPRACQGQTPHCGTPRPVDPESTYDPNFHRLH